MHIFYVVLVFFSYIFLRNGVPNSLDRNRIVYTSKDLSAYRRKQHVSAEVLCTLKLLAINKQPRGTRGGAKQRRSADRYVNKRPQCNIQQQIQTIIGHRNAWSHISQQTNSLNINNLKLVQKCGASPKLLKITHLNARSIRNKAEEIATFITDNSIDILAITETWLAGNDSDSLHIRLATPNGYDFIHHPRTSAKGGGVAILFKDELHVTVQKTKQITSFEHIEVTTSIGNDCVRLVCIYRPPLNSRCSVPTSQFVQDFSQYIDSLATSTGRLLVVGDFNVHFDKTNDQNTRMFRDAIDSLNLNQHINEPTHQKGHTLDLVLTRPDTCPIYSVLVSPPSLSDHFPISVTVQFHKPCAKKVLITSRNLKRINQHEFQSDLSQCELITNPPENLTDLVNMYNRTLIQLLDKHAPIQTKTIALRHNAKWFTEPLRKAKTECRRAENRWRKNKLSVHQEDFKYKFKAYTNLCRKAKSCYYQQQIADCVGDQKKLFKITEKLLKSERKPALPPGLDSAVIAETFSNYFAEKIENIRATFEQKNIQLLTIVVPIRI